MFRSIHESGRRLTRALSEEEEWIVSLRERKKVEMLLAHLKRILDLDRHYEDRAAPETSSASQQPPKTSARWPS